MKKFRLISKDLHDFKEGKNKDLMYQIEGNEKILKKIIYDKISYMFDPLKLNPNIIKKINIYVTSEFDNMTEIWLDIDENNDLFFIYKDKNLKINNVEKIQEFFIDWLLG